MRGVTGTTPVTVPGVGTDDPRVGIVLTYFKHLRLPAMAREGVSLAREAEHQGLG